MTLKGGDLGLTTSYLYVDQMVVVQMAGALYTRVWYHCLAYNLFN